MHVRADIDECSSTVSRSAESFASDSSSSVAEEKNAASCFDRA